MAPKWMYLQYLQHLVPYTDSDLALALLAIAERNLPVALCVSCAKVGAHVTWKRNRNAARRWRSVWVAVQHDGTWLILAAWMSGTCIKRICITFGLFDITQPMGNVRHLMDQLDWPHGLAMALHWLPLCDQVKEHKRRTRYLVSIIIPLARWLCRTCNCYD